MSVVGGGIQESPRGGIRTKQLFIFTIAAATAWALTTASSASAQVISQGALSVLVARAEQSGTVTSAEAVPTTAGAALELNPHFVPDESAMPQSVAETPVLVVAMHGHFVYQMAKVRPGTDPPEGSTFAYTVDSATGEVAATYVGNESPKLSTLGAVERFTASQSSAIISRATHRLPHIKPSRLRAKAATWGSGCKITENYHCYVLATWGMTGSEEVEATQEEQKTTTMNVPESANGDFVDMEEWVLFSNGTKYVEAGQEGGAHKGCCTIWWFWALTYGPNPGEYFAYEGPPYTWEIPYNVYAHYEWKSINPTNATWCLIIGPNWETQYACYTGFSVYTKDLEAGGEIATEQKPSFAGSQLVNGQWLNGTYKGWSFASYGTIGPKGSAPGLCYGYIGPTPGDMNYGTC